MNLTFKKVDDSCYRINEEEPDCDLRIITEIAEMGSGLLIRSHHFMYEYEKAHSIGEYKLKTVHSHYIDHAPKDFF